MHPDVGSHAAQSVALVSADLAAEGFDALMGVHVTLGRAGCRTDGAADRTSPAACAAAGAGMISAGLYYRLPTHTNQSVSLNPSSRCPRKIDKGVKDLNKEPEARLKKTVRKAFLMVARCQYTL